MIYCILALENILPAIHQPKRKWQSGDQIIAGFYDSPGAATSELTSFGENEAALWVMVGQLFQKSDYSSCTVDAKLIASVLHNPGYLARHYWGKYWLILYDKRSHRWFIFADPCGQLPLYYRKGTFGELHLGAHVSDFCAIGNCLASPNKDYLYNYLCYGRGESEQTGIEGLFVLPTGALLCKEPHQPLTVQRCWFPLDAHIDPKKQDPIDLLVKTFNATFANDANIVLELSGGVDSTALAIALQRAGLNERTLAVTYFSKKRQATDEVAMAAQVAQHCRIPHQTVAYEATPLPFSSFSETPIVARPSLKLCRLKAHAYLSSYFRANHGAYSMLNGHGGDALFGTFPSCGVPIDTFARGRFIRAITAIRDLAVLYRLPLVGILRAAWQAAIHPHGSRMAETFSTDIINSTSVARPRRSGDSLINDFALKLQPAKRQELTMCVATFESSIVQLIPAFCRSFLPFLFQPLVEWALSWKPEDTFTADYSRLPIRQSVYQATRLSTIWRTDKGDGTYPTLLGISKNEDYITEMCLDGWCASQGWINKDNMKNVIHSIALGHGSRLKEIMHVFALEIFIQGISRNASLSPA